MFRERLTSHPIPFDPDAGAAAVADLAPPPDLVPLIEGSAGCSAYLGGLMRKERDWMSDIWDSAPEDVLADIVAEVGAIDGDPGAALRQAKRRAALLVGLCDLGGVWPVMEATWHWTHFADACVRAALAWALRRYGKAPVEGDGGLVAIAMGKMGAGELNYSSDIDLVLLFDETRYAPDEYAAVRPILLKAARAMSAQLSDIRAEGYVFRTDLRLRPDPASTPIVLSMEAAERYYEAMGRTWERAAWIKARACAGAVPSGEGIIDRLKPFVWRRHLDFAAVEDAHDMRLRIRDHKGLGGPWDVPGHDVKLGQGGIREIEFFAQTQQLVLGGRDPSLRVRGTLPALDALVAAGQVAGGVRDQLSDNYRRLRRVEHRLQMVQDSQTHRLPSDADGLRRIACFLGRDDVDGFVADLRDRMRAVEAIVDPAFAPRAPKQAPDPIDGAGAVTDRWLTYPALRSERARDIFRRLRPDLLRELAGAARPSEALLAFDAFLRGLPAGVQVLSLFEANPKLVALLADICATAPDLARYLSQNAGVLDAVLDGSFFAPLPRCPSAPDLPDDFEDALETLRRWHRDWHFRIGVHLLRDLEPPELIGRAYADLADATLQAAWDVSLAETARRYGRVPRLRVGVCGMGSLGAQRLTARSDLDLVVIHDGGEGALSDGRRQLSAGQWAAKATKVLITALSAPTGTGRLYEVDMRLRPSGRQGPVATALSGFRAYQAQESWVWEHLAVTRARPVAGPRSLRVAMERARRDVLGTGRFTRDEVLAELGAMFGRLRAAKPGGGLDPKDGPGRLQEIELAAQAQAVLARAPVRATAAQLALTDWLTEGEAEILTETHARFSRQRQILRLLTDGGDGAALGTGGAEMLAARLGMPDLAALEADMAARAAEARAVLAAALDRAGVQA
ncbi:MAG: glutamine-synthetase adenylyltransferase [Pseudomonadota bacterium]